MADEVRELSGKIGLDTTDFKTAIAGANRELRVLESGFRASAAGLSDWSKDASGLEARIESLTRQIDIQKSKVSAVRSEYERVAQEKGKTSRAAQDLQIKLNRETETLNKMERELRDTDQALENVGKESKTTGNKTEDLKKSEDRARVSTDKLGGALSGLHGRLKSATSGIGGLLTKLGQLTTRLAIGVAGAAAIAVGAISALAVSTIGPASDLNETISKVEVVFGDLSDGIIEFGENAAESLGMSENAALSAAGTYGNLFRSMGIGLDTSADMSKGLVSLAADLASFNNMTPEEVLDSLRSGLSGETEPLKRLGVNINQAILQEKAYEMGLIRRGEAMSAAVKAQATYALVMEQTTLAQGDFARTSGGLANQQRILSATIENLRAKIGTALLPIVTQGITLLNKFLNSPTAQAGIEKLTTWIGELSGKFQLFIDDLQNGKPVHALVDLFGPDMAGKIMTFKDGIDGVSDTVGKLFDAFKTGGIGGVFKELTSGLDTGDLAGTVGEMIGNLLMGFATKPARLLEIGLSLINGLASALTTAIPALLPVVMQIINSFIQFIVTSLPVIMNAGIQILLALINGIVPQLPMLVTTGIQLIITLVQGIAEAIPQIMPVIAEVIPQIIIALVENLPLLIDAALQLIIALQDGFIVALPILIEYIPEIVTAIFGALVAAAPVILEAGGEIVQNVIDGVSAWLPEVIESAGELIDAFINGIDWEKILDVGTDIVTGVWEGIKGAAEWFTDLVTEFFGGIVDSIKEFLGISSPSRVFAGIGENMALGMGAGFASAFRDIEGQVSQAVNNLVPAVNVGLAGSGQAAAAAPVSITIQANVAKDMDMHILARRIAQEIQRSR